VTNGVEKLKLKQQQLLSLGMMNQAQIVLELQVMQCCVDDVKGRGDVIPKTNKNNNKNNMFERGVVKQIYKNKK
jgi:hypothetical protein